MSTCSCPRRFWVTKGTPGTLGKPSECWLRNGCTSTFGIFSRVPPRARHPCRRPSLGTRGTLIFKDDKSPLPLVPSFGDFDSPKSARPMDLCRPDFGSSTRFPLPGMFWPTPWNFLQDIRTLGCILDYLTRHFLPSLKIQGAPLSPGLCESTPTMDWGWWNGKASTLPNG